MVEGDENSSHAHRIAAARCTRVGDAVRAHQPYVAEATGAAQERSEHGARLRVVHRVGVESEAAQRLNAEEAVIVPASGLRVG